MLYAKKPLDREDQDLYTLMIQAIDNPASTSNQLTDSLLIRIRVLDVNDNKPYCEQDAYTIETVQNVQPGTVLLQVKAIDADQGTNAQLNYHLTLLDRSAGKKKLKINIIFTFILRTWGREFSKYQEEFDVKFNEAFFLFTSFK
jgi:hypothetical protein